MNKKKHLIFVMVMSIFVALITVIPDFIMESIKIERGYLVVAFILLLFLILVYYRYLDYQNASFKRLLTAGVSIIFFGILLSFFMEMGHHSIIGEVGVQKIIDRKVEKQIKSYDGTKLNIFEIEKEVTERVRPSGLNDILGMLFGLIGLSLLMFIFSLILRTDKKPLSIE